MNWQDQKRVTVRLKCPNPLFEEWLIGWKEQAAAKESKMQYIFNQALKSLKKYPLPLESGRDCKILKGFGDKLCKMLDERLKEHKKTDGTRIINKANSLPPINGDIEGTVTKNKKKPTYVNKKCGSNSQQYIPQYGSGSYGILISLYKQSLEPNYPGFSSKTEIIQYGKDLVNTSFTKPDPGSRYTAWNSMRTLISKNLVSKRSHPPKFSLTQEGEILARKLYENSSENENNDEKSTDDSVHLISQNYVAENKISKRTNTAMPGDFIEENKGVNMKNNITNNFKLYDVDIPDEITDELLRNTWISENDTFSVNTNNDHIKFYNDLDNMKLGNHDTTKNVNSDMKKCCTETSEAKEIERLEESYGNLLVPLNSTELVGTSKQTNSMMPVSRVLSRRSKSLKEGLSESVPLSLTHSFHRFSSSNSISSVKSVTHIIPIKNNQNTLKRFASSSSVSSATSTVSVIENFVMAPNSFDVILYVDNNETSGSSNSQNDEILMSLTRQGINHEVKDLKVGDFVWICRHRITKNELVLPYIVERKRMDDFAHSIKDKRYYEQKFRLKKSGIENLIYLVESHGKNQHTGLPLQTLHQAASNTAIQENFFIKFTENMTETVEYLANLSRLLVKMFKSKNLASCSKDYIQPVDITDDLVSLMTFKELNDTSVKNKRMKVTELFVKMLVQIKGMSVERALAITQMYPTPIILKRMYEENTDSDGEKLLSGLKYGRCGKSIGAVLSKTVYQAFSKTQY